MTICLKVYTKTTMGLLTKYFLLTVYSFEILYESLTFHFFITSKNIVLKVFMKGLGCFIQILTCPKKLIGSIIGLPIAYNYPVRVTPASVHLDGVVAYIDGVFVDCVNVDDVYVVVDHGVYVDGVVAYIDGVVIYVAGCLC